MRLAGLLCGARAQGKHFLAPAGIYATWATAPPFAQCKHDLSVAVARRDCAHRRRCCLHIYRCSQSRCEQADWLPPDSTWNSQVARLRKCPVMDEW